MSIVLPFAEKIVVEKVSGDILFPRSLATAITCTYSRQFSGFYLISYVIGKRNDGTLRIMMP
jgi:hypothetical protein